jgi:hypothetical protein
MLFVALGMIIAYQLRVFAVDSKLCCCRLILFMIPGLWEIINLHRFPIVTCFIPTQAIGTATSDRIHGMLSAANRIGAIMAPTTVVLHGVMLKASSDHVDGTSDYDGFLTFRQYCG